MPTTQMKQRVTLRNILFATDFSSAANSAMLRAASLARSFDSKLFAMHVKEPIDYAVPPEMWASAEQACEMELQQLRDSLNSSERHLRDLVPEEAKSWYAPHFLVEMGVPTDKILEVAHRIHADLIVLGAHTTEGVPGAATHLTIATVHPVVAHAACQVLTHYKRAPLWSRF
jgi:nucleotide-binding universal stress UspA family protein